MVWTFLWNTDILAFLKETFASDDEPSNSKAKDEKVNDEKATMKKVPLKSDLIIQLKDLLDNFNNLEAINFKNLETIRDLQAKVEALEKEKCETLRQTKQTQAETVS